MVDDIGINDSGTGSSGAAGVDEWIDSAIPAGSGRYYALLHSNSALQKQQRLLATLVSIFSKLGFQSREIEVVKHKLEWWRHELEKESFNHPVMNAFDGDSVTPVMRSQLKQLLNGYGGLLESGSPSTDEQNQQFHLDTGATACHLICSTQNSDKSVTDAGVVLSKFRCFRYLRQHVDNGLLCLPLQQEMQKSSNALAQQVLEADEPDRSRYKALYIYLALQHKLLRSMQKDNVSVVEE